MYILYAQSKYIFSGVWVGVPTSDCLTLSFCFIRSVLNVIENPYARKKDVLPHIYARSKYIFSGVCVRVCVRASVPTSEYVHGSFCSVNLFLFVYSCCNKILSLTMCCVL